MKPWRWAIASSFFFFLLFFLNQSSLLEYFAFAFSLSFSLCLLKFPSTFTLFYSYISQSLRERERAGSGFREACVGSGLDRDAESRGVVLVCEWLGVTVELGWCPDIFRPLKPRSRKKGRLRSGLGLRHLRDEPPWSGGGWWSERSLSCWPWRVLERAQVEIEEREREGSVRWFIVEA